MHTQVGIVGAGPAALLLGRANAVEMTETLLSAGACALAANQSGATPMLLAAMNGNAAILERLIQAGADPNAHVSKIGDTALMIAARTGNLDAVRVLLDHQEQVKAKETWGGTTALMWAVSERHPDVVKLLVERGADVNAKSNLVPSASGRGFEGTAPVPPKPYQASEEFASGWLTPLMFAAREDDLKSARILIQAGADVNAFAADGKDALGLALFNGSYDVASLLIDSHANVNHADAQRFTPLFWAVDRRNMETAPNFPWMVTTDPLPVIQRLVDAGANPSASRCRTRPYCSSPRRSHRAIDPLHDDGVPFGNVLEDARAERASARSLKQALVGHGQPQRGPNRSAPSLRLVCAPRVLNRLLGHERHNGIDLGIYAINLFQMSGHSLAGADAFACAA